jgi:hypothetical protein
LRGCFLVEQGNPSDSREACSLTSLRFSLFFLLLNQLNEPSVGPAEIKHRTVRLADFFGETVKG